jgi:hypothetical protein
MRAATQPWARALGADAEKPSNTAEPKMKTLTPLETRIDAVVWLIESLLYLRVLYQEKRSVKTFLGRVAGL